MATIASLAVDVIANTGRFVSDLKKAADGVKGFEKKTTASFNKLKRSVRRFENSITTLKGAIAGIGFAMLTRELITQISTYQNLTNKIRLVTRDSEHLLQTQTSLFEMAQKSRASLEGTSDLYARLARSTKSLALSDQSLLDITESVNQAVTISGSSAASSAAALFQFGQGLAADALRGQELNSIMEQTPRLAQAIADGLGIELGQLREVAKQGLLTSDVVVKALQSQSKVLKDEFGRTEVTISQAFQQIENAALKAFGEMDADDLVKSMQSFANIVSDPDIVKGLQSIASMLLEIVKLGVRVAAGWGMIIGLVKDAVDPSIQSQLSSMTDEMASLNERIKDAVARGTPYQSLITDLQALAVKHQKLRAELSKDLGGTDDKAKGGAKVVDISPEIMNAARLKDALLIIEQQKLEQIQGYKDSAFDYEFESAIRQEDRLNDMHDQRLEYRLEQERLAAEQWNSIWQSAQDTFVNGMGNAIADVIVDQKNLAEAMNSLLKNVAKQIISNLITVAIKQALLSKTAGVQAQILAGQMTMAWAAPAAFAATATVGGAVATGSAALGTFVAANQAIAAGQFHNGTDYVPSTGSYVLEKGEAVIDKGTSEKMRNNIGANGGITNVTNVYLNAIDTQSGADFFQKHKADVFNANADLMHENALSYS